MKRIVLFGATGYTGRLTAEAMVRRGEQPVLAGRKRDDLAELAKELGGLEFATADVARPGSVRELVERGDVLVSTVGPFTRLGVPAVEAALAKGAHYVDSNGEPPFTRRIFEVFDTPARQDGIALLTAFGWECVLGNLAAALALRAAGDQAVRIDTGYFYVGRTGFSGGTRASFANAAVHPSFAFRDGGVRTVAGAERCRTFPVGGSRRPAVSFGGSEHFALPRIFPGLREVNTYLGWFGRLPPQTARLLHLASRAGSRGLEGRPLRSFAERTVSLLRGSTGGPTDEQRAQGRVHVVALAYDGGGEPVADTHLSGAEGYEFTAKVLAWGASQLASRTPRGTGALGPVEAFGLGQLEAGCRAAGVRPSASSPRRAGP